ncbi:triphosphoribosyl-dephospho-CoA synthase [Candidatus Izemoplasma sp. B36]|uniref:triphosphoribosyl-dephospho-CoA synthase n=1 Tax=Candidatus Izemoplasma sp. B36 TaxID=3242468 RepID=UPI003558DF6F
MKTENIQDKILSSREQKASKIQFLKSDFKTVITVKSNIPGNEKRNRFAYILVDYFMRKIPRDIYTKRWYYDSFDGPYYLMGSNLDSKEIKNLTMDLEDNNPIGRFIDIDVFNGKNTFSRNKMRRCYLCEKPAFVCIRESNHSVKELNEHLEKVVFNFFIDDLLRLVNQSMILELNLHPKFGLVTPITSGSHNDMNYDLMIKAKDSIIPLFKDMFIIGFSNQNLQNIFNQIKKIGIKAERAMYEATNNINAYKGLIFNLGITVTAYAYCLYNHISLNNIFKIIKEMTKEILSDFDRNDIDSNGYYSYKKFNILGARGEVYNGLPSVQNALNYLKDFSQESRLRTLMYLISVSNDTVLLKRSKSIENYRYIKKLFNDNLKSSNKEVERINSYCIKNNLSFGGSADLLILTIFLKKLLT